MEIKHFQEPELLKSGEAVILFNIRFSATFQMHVALHFGAGKKKIAHPFYEVKTCLENYRIGRGFLSESIVKDG